MTHILKAASSEDIIHLKTHGQLRKHCVQEIVNTFSLCAWTSLKTVVSVHLILIMSFHCARFHGRAVLIINDASYRLPLHNERGHAGGDWQWRLHWKRWVFRKHVWNEVRLCIPWGKPPSLCHQRSLGKCVWFRCTITFGQHLIYLYPMHSFWRPKAYTSFHNYWTGRVFVASHLPNKANSIICMVSVGFYSSKCCFSSFYKHQMEEKLSKYEWKYNKVSVILFKLNSIENKTVVFHERRQSGFTQGSRGYMLVWWQMADPQHPLPLPPSVQKERRCGSASRLISPSYSEGNTHTNCVSLSRSDQCSDRLTCVTLCDTHTKWHNCTITQLHSPYVVEHRQVHVQMYSNGSLKSILFYMILKL